MKKVSVKESQINKIIKELTEKILNEKTFSIEPNVSEIPRERNLRKVFGSYEPEVSDDTIRYMRKNPRLIIKRLIDIYGDKFFDMVDLERQRSMDTQGPLDEEFDDYNPEAEKREEINRYLKYLTPVVKGDDEFDSNHLIEVDYFPYENRNVDVQIDLNVSVPDTGYEKFDKIVAKNMVNFLLNRANDSMDRQQLKVNSIKVGSKL